MAYHFEPETQKLSLLMRQVFAGLTGALLLLGLAAFTTIVARTLIVEIYDLVFQMNPILAASMAIIGLVSVTYMTSFAADVVRGCMRIARRILGIAHLSRSHRQDISKENTGLAAE